MVCTPVYAPTPKSEALQRIHSQRAQVHQPSQKTVPKAEPPAPWQASRSRIGHWDLEMNWKRED